MQSTTYILILQCKVCCSLIVDKLESVVTTSDCIPITIITVPPASCWYGQLSYLLTPEESIDTRVHIHRFKTYHPESNCCNNKSHNKPHDEQDEIKLTRIEDKGFFWGLVYRSQHKCLARFQIITTYQDREQSCSYWTTWSDADGGRIVFKPNININII